VDDLRVSPLFLDVGDSFIAITATGKFKAAYPLIRNSYEALTEGTRMNTVTDGDGISPRREFLFDDEKSALIIILHSLHPSDGKTIIPCPD
jgi:hypothetical protein